MQPEESLYPADWLRIAEKDWGRAKRLLDAGDAELAGLCLQQAVEKFLIWSKNYGRRFPDQGGFPCWFVSA